MKSWKTLLKKETNNSLKARRRLRDETVNQLYQKRAHPPHENFSIIFPSTYQKKKVRQPASQPACSHSVRGGVYTKGTVAKKN